MLVTKRNKSSAGAILAAVLASTALINFPFISAHSSSRTPGIGPARASVVSPADGSGALAITPALDTARAVSATMAEKGGTLSVTAANGTTFTLTIPPDALVSEEDIAMTPVAAIPDLPFSQGLGGGGAVQLGPEGLLLVKPATLMIQPASPISVDQQCPFAWYKAGEDFHLSPLSLDLTTLTMDVDNFKGYGIAGGSSGDRDAVAAHTPTRSEARFTQQLEQATDALRQKLSQNLTRKQVKKANKSYNNQILQNFVSEFADLDKELEKDLGLGGSGAAPQSRTQGVAPAPAIVRCDLLKVLALLIKLRYLGHTLADIGQDGDQGVKGLLTEMLQSLELDSIARCREGNLGEIGTLLGLAKFALILAALDPSLAGLSNVAKNISNEAANCAQLKLTFDSTITSVVPTAGAFNVSIELEATDVPLTPVLGAGDDLLFYFGSAPLIHHIDTVDAGASAHCSTSNTCTNSTLKIISLEFNIHLRLVQCPGADATPPTDLDLIIDVGRPLENFTVTCPCQGCSYSTPGDTDIWRAQFYCEHNVLGNGTATLFRFRNWDFKGTSNLALKLFQHVVPPVCPAYDEFTVIKVNPV
ncbi:MAG TPA: hypothetical protein VNO24_13845 [Blastocatellia bacterium]|nr:hypothetical protein [Blastocatellia bacterium]